MLNNVIQDEKKKERFMKKKLLVIQALLLLPLISTSSLLSMDSDTEKKFNTSTVKTDNQSTTTQTPVQEEEIVVDLTFINNEKKYPNKKEYLTKKQYETKFSTILNDLCEKISSDQNILSKSVLVQPIPQEEGLSGSLYWSSFTTGSDELIYTALQDGSFNPNNKTHMKYLERAFENHIKNNNAERIQSMLEYCRTYKTSIGLTDRIAREIHGYLEKINNQREINTKNITINENIDFINKYNALIAALQKETTNRFKEIQEQLESYTKQHTSTFEKHAHHMRTNKIGTATIHEISPLLTLGRDETCSCQKINNPAQYTCPNQIKNIHTNRDLSAKNGINLPHAHIVHNVCDSIQKMYYINEQIKALPLLELKKTNSKINS